MENAELLTALPPSSIDAERSVLGAVLQDVGAATLAFETLAPEDFYSAEHKEIFGAMRALHISGSPIDLMTVSEELSKHGTLDSVGGSGYLLQAVRFVPTTANTRTYIEIVLEKSTLRKLIAASQRIASQCYAQSDPLINVLRDAERLIFDIVMKRSGAETLMPLQKVLMSTFDQIEEMSRLKGRLAGVPTGIYDLDRMLTCMHGGELILVGARPAMGKTAMALGVAQFAAVKSKKCVAIFSMEMPNEQIGMRILRLVMLAAESPILVEHKVERDGDQQVDQRRDACGDAAAFHPQGQQRRAEQKSAAVGNKRLEIRFHMLPDGIVYARFEHIPAVPEIGVAHADHKGNHVAELIMPAQPVITEPVDPKRD